MNLVKVAQSLACLLASGDYFTRIALSVRSIVEVSLVIVRRRPTPKSMLQQQLFLDLFFPKPTPNATPKHKNAFADLRTEFEILLTGVPGFSWVHHCYPGGPCKCKSVADTKDRVTNVILNTVFRQRPKKPEVKEWTAVSQSFSFVSFGIFTYDVFFKCWTASTDAIAGADNRRSHRGKAVTDTETFFLEMDFNELNGKRVQCVTDALRDSWLRFRFWYASLLVCCSELTSKQYMYWTSEQGIVPLFEKLDPSRTPDWTVLQFFAALLSDGVLIADLFPALLCRVDWKDALTNDANIIAEFRAICVNFGTWTWIRHQFRYHRWPFWLARVADERVPYADRFAIAVAFCATPFHDLDSGFC